MTSRSTMLRVMAISGFCASILIGATASAFAQDVNVIAARPATQKVITHIGYADLDLTAAAGRQMLGQRISAAAASVCDASLFSPSLTGDEGFTCRDYAVAGTRQQVRQAVRRAQQMAANGTSGIAPVAIAVSAAL